MSKHSVTIRGLRVETTCWSWAWSNRTSPSKWVGLGSPLAASSVYGDLTCSVHTVNNLCMFNCKCHFYLCNRGPYVRLTFVPNMLSSWNKDIIKDPSFLHADSEDSDQTGRMPRLIWVFAGHTVTLLVLSCRGWNVKRVKRERWRGKDDNTFRK